MRDSDTFPEYLRRHLAHIYASLRECISDELEYDRSPDFEPLDDKMLEELSQLIYTELTALMYAAHAEEATTIAVQCAEEAERIKEVLSAATWQLEVEEANADWLDALGKDANDKAL